MIDWPVVHVFRKQFLKLTERNPDILNTSEGSFKLSNSFWIEPPKVTQQLPTKQPRRKTGVAQARRDARKRRNRK